MGTDWRELLEAALRRVRFAEGHHRDLLIALSEADEHPDVPLDVQRHFDALLTVFVSVAQQVRDAILVATEAPCD